MPLSPPVDITQRMLDRLPEQFKGKPRLEALARSYGKELQAFADAQWLLYSSRLLQNGPAQIVGRATFIGDDTATLYWPFPFKDTNYLMLPGKAVVTDGGGPVVVSVDNTTKTTTSVTLTASALFTGYVNVLAWNPGENPLQRGIGGDLLDKIGKIIGESRGGLTDGEYWTLVTAKIASNRSDGRRETLIRIAKLLTPGASVYVKDFPPCAVYVAPQLPIQTDPYVAGQFLVSAKAAGVNLVFAWSVVPLESTVTWGSIHASGFSAGPPPTSGGVLAGQCFGSVHAPAFIAGPPSLNGGVAGIMAGVIQG